MDVRAGQARILTGATSRLRTRDRQTVAHCEITAPSQTQALAEDMMGGVEKCAREVWFARDSPLEEAGFELSVPPERKAALDRVRRPLTRRQA